MIFDIIFNIAKYLNLAYYERLMKTNRELFLILENRYKRRIQRYQKLLEKIKIYTTIFNAFRILGDQGYLTYE